MKDAIIHVHNTDEVLGQLPLYNKKERIFVSWRNREKRVSLYAHFKQSLFIKKTA